MLVHEYEIIYFYSLIINGNQIWLRLFTIVNYIDLTFMTVMKFELMSIYKVLENWNHNSINHKPSINFNSSLQIANSLIIKYIRFQNKNSTMDFKNNFKA